MSKIKAFVKKETVLTVAWILAVISAFFVLPDKDYIDYIDWRSLGILWSLMIIMKGMQVNGIFEKIGLALLNKTKKVWQLSAVLVFLCFFCSMFITNDVALITFVPFAIMMLRQCDRENLLIPVIVLQTIAANLGSMLTPIGNPQNLYLYGLSGMGMDDFILWMLPVTLISMVLLAVSLAFIKGKFDYLEGTKKDHKVAIDSKRNVVLYTLLFVVALMTVARLLPYYVVVGIVLIVVFIIQKEVLTQIDYALLFTFVGFFIFTGNMGRITAISDALSKLVLGKEIAIGVLASQCISNVPAALLLSGFTNNIKGLLYGVNLGGLGTLIASMASLISFKSLAHEYNEKKGKYFLVFTGVNIIYLAILMGITYVFLV